MLETIKGDVRATLALLMGLLEVHVASPHETKNKCTKLLEVWRRMWNLRRTGTPQVGMMIQRILHRGDYGEEFKRDFVLYVYYQKYE